MGQLNIPHTSCLHETRNKYHHLITGKNITYQSIPVNTKWSPANEGISGKSHIVRYCLDDFHIKNHIFSAMLSKNASLNFNIFGIKILCADAVQWP